MAEPRATGHRMRYVGNLSRQARQRGHQVTIVTTPQALSSTAFQQFVDVDLQKSAFIAQDETSKRSVIASLGFQQHKIYLWFKSTMAELLAKQHIDVVLIPYFNYIDKAVALLGSPFGNIPWSGIVMRESFHHVRLGLKPNDDATAFLKEQLFNRLLANPKLLTMVTIDETLKEYGKTKFKRFDRLSYAPDPSDVSPTVDRTSACQQLNLRSEDFHLLCYGHIDDRKGIAELLNAVSEKIPSHFTLVIAGRYQPATRQIIESFSQKYPHSRLLLLNQFIDSGLEQQLFSAADAVWVGYKNHFGSSGLLGQAAAAGKPVIACDQGLIGYLTDRHQLGITVNIANPESVRSAITTLSSDAELRARCARAGQAFSNQRTVAHFSNAILDELESKTRTAH